MALIAQHHETAAGVVAEIGLGDLERGKHELALAEIPAQAAFILAGLDRLKLLVAVGGIARCDAAVLQPPLGCDVGGKRRRQFDQQCGIVEPRV
jgi:hypothetical protein